MPSLDVTQQLVLLKSITCRMGIVHEAQLLQLKQWPLLIPNVKKATIEVDIEHKGVRFKLDTKKAFKVNKLTKKYFTNIRNWIRFILWDDTYVVFSAKNKVTYDSRFAKSD